MPERSLLWRDIDRLTKQMRNGARLIGRRDADVAAIVANLSDELRGFAHRYQYEASRSIQQAQPGAGVPAGRRRPALCPGSAPAAPSGRGHANAAAMPEGGMTLEGGSGCAIAEILPTANRVGVIGRKNVSYEKISKKFKPRNRRNPPSFDCFDSNQ